MALIPSTEWPSQTAAPNAAYPLGGAQNITTPGDNTGTPFVANMVNDWFGFFQGILSTAGITASGAPDTAVTSQYRDALDFIIAASITTNVPAATESVAGKAEIATQVETDAGLDDERFITPLKLAQSTAGTKTAVYADVKSSGVAGGTSSSGNQTRTLNTELSDLGGLGTLSANEVTLIAGTYAVQAYSTSFQSGDHAIYLNDGSSRVLSGVTSFNDSGNGDAATVSIINGVIVSTGSETYSIDHFISAAQSTDGLGRAVSSGTSSIFSMLQFTKIG